MLWFATLSPAFVVRPVTRQLTTRQQAPCYRMAQPAAASNGAMFSQTQCNLAFSSFSFRVNGGVPAVFRLSLQKDSLCAPAGESAVFCCTDGAVCTASLAYSVLASKVEEDTVREDEAALTLLASDSPEPGAATRLPLGQATALALAYAEQQIRRDTGRRKAKRKCGPGSFCDSPGGEVACIEEASDGSLAWVRA